MSRSCVAGVALFVFSFLVCGVLVADQQPPFSLTELDNFINDWPRFVAWAGDRATKVGEPAAAGTAPGQISVETKAYLAARGWQPDRFFYIAGNATTGLIAIEVGQQETDDVHPLEQQRTIIRDSPDLTELQKAEMIEAIDETIRDMGAGFSGRIPESEMEFIRMRQDQLRYVLEPDY